MRKKGKREGGERDGEEETTQGKEGKAPPEGEGVRGKPLLLLPPEARPFSVRLADPAGQPASG